MTIRTQRYDAVVTRRDPVSPHLVRLTLSVPGFESTGILDEWVGLVVPGQFQVRYYTVCALDGDELVLDVVIHDVGLVTEWASGDCVGDSPVITAAQGSFSPPSDAAWLLLVGDLTAMPAMARISRATTVPTRVWAEVPDDLSGYLPDGADVTWLEPPAEGRSRLPQGGAGIALAAG